MNELQSLKSKISELDEKKLNLNSHAADWVAIAGALGERNAWVRTKKKSPINLLSKLEENKPGGVTLKNFDGNINGGSLKALAPDMETMALWLNSTFENQNGKMTVEGRDEGRILVQFSWTG